MYMRRDFLCAITRQNLLKAKTREGLEQRTGVRESRRDNNCPPGNRKGLRRGISGILVTGRHTVFGGKVVYVSVGV